MRSAGPLSPRRAWLVRGEAETRGEAVLLELGPTPEPVLELLRSEIPPGPWRAFNEYALIAPDGRLQRYASMPFSSEDDLGVTSHAVIDDSLRSLFLVLHTGFSFRKTLDESARLTGLSPIPLEHPAVQAALGRAWLP